MTLIQALVYGVLIVLVTAAAWLAGQADGKRRGYKTGYEDGKEYVRATPEYREFLTAKAVYHRYLASKSVYHVDLTPVTKECAYRYDIRVDVLRRDG